MFADGYRDIADFFDLWDLHISTTKRYKHERTAERNALLTIGDTRTGVFDIFSRKLSDRLT